MNPGEPLAVLFPAGNYGKVVEVRSTKKSRDEQKTSKEQLKSSREDLTEETQGLLESEDELEMQSPEPEKRSVSAAMIPQPTEYDR